MIEEIINRTLREAELQGSWSAYAVFCLGEANTGDADLDEAIRCLYEANESVHRIANKLALRYELEFFGGL